MFDLPDGLLPEIQDVDYGSTTDTPRMQGCPA